MMTVKKQLSGAMVSALIFSCALTASAKAGENDNPFVQKYADGTITFSFDAALAGFYSEPTYWGIVDAFVPGAKTEYKWIEGAAELGMRVDHRVTGDFTFYGGVSAIATFTEGTDIFETVDVFSLTNDDLFGGMKIGNPGDDFYLDLSGGSQAYAAGAGLLIGDGAPEGSARGAVVYAPFNAWDQAAIGRIGHGPFLFEAFYLDADEIYEPDTKTTLAGANIKYTLRPNEYVGIFGGYVLESEAPYFRALPGLAGSVILPGARDGLQFVNAYGRWNPLHEQAPGFFIAGDLAYQTHDDFDMDAWAVRAAIGNKFENLPLTPTLTYSFQMYSGDDPSTSSLERFDPLLGGGSPEYFAIGNNSSLLFAASNINVHRIGLNTALTPQDFLNFSYFHIRANELNSPLTLDQDPSGSGFGSLPPSLVSSGSYVLADEFGVSYTHAFSANMFLNLAVNYSIPGGALQDLGAGRLDDWFTANATFVVSY